MYQRIHKYLAHLTPERPPVLREMERYAAENDFPIVGPLVGRVLYQLALTVRARRVLELGSGFGYSAMWFSMAMGSRGHILMTDLSRRHRQMALKWLKEAGLKGQFTFRVGNAVNVLKRINETFDILFNDIDKEDYPEVIDSAAARLRKGGLFVTDNVLWSGRVYEKKQDRATRAIVDFTKALYADTRFFTTILPLRDGLAVAVRL